MAFGQVLWVEGPSEAVSLTVLAEHELGSPDLASVTIRQMPDASRFSGRSRQKAEATYRFCSEIISAVSPLPVKTVFLFDRDEKTAEIVSQIEESSGGRAIFLPVRELENLFLDPSLIVAAIQARCRELDLAERSNEDISARFEALLQATDDRKVWPRKPVGDEEPLRIVRGSAILAVLYWEFTTSEYDKPLDAKVLTELALARTPALLQPLRDALDAVLRPRDRDPSA